MSTSNCQTSACRLCRHFTPEGRRGGNCQQLGVPVRGSWRACSLAMPPFAPSWENMEGIGILSKETLRVRDAIRLERSLNCDRGQTADPVSASGNEKLDAKALLV